MTDYMMGARKPACRIEFCRYFGQISKDECVFVIHCSVVAVSVLSAYRDTSERPYRYDIPSICVPRFIEIQERTNERRDGRTNERTDKTIPIVPPTLSRVGLIIAA